MASLKNKKDGERIISPRLRIELLGAFRITCGGRDVDLQSRKSRAIIGALALSEDWKQPRERFHGLLWSEADGDRARASLRTAIYDIRSVLDEALPGAFVADKHMLWLDRAKVEVDLWEALEGAKRGVPTAPLLERERVTESILADCENVDPAFRDWLTAKRQSIHTRLVAALEDSLRRFPETATDPRIEPLARAITRLDPTHEEAVRALIRARAAAGDLGGAFRIVKALWDLLDTEFEIKPSNETRKLIAALRLSQSEDDETLVDPTSSVASTPPPVSHILAVEQTPLPAPLSPVAARKLVINIGGFDASGVKTENRYLITGFRQELAACLVRFREWSVRDQSRMPAGAAPGGTGDGMYVIDASAFETSDSVRLVLMLRDLATGEYVWSERLLLSVKSWFDAQQQVVRRIATTLNVNVSAERVASQARLPQHNYGAYDLWLRAQHLIFTRVPENMSEAVRICERLIAEYPTFGPGFLVLANYLNIYHIHNPGVLRDSKRTAEALRLAREAVRLDPVNSRAHLCLAWSLAMARQPHDAHVAAALAFELNDNDAWTRASAVSCRALCGITADMTDIIDDLALNEQLIAPLQWGYHASTEFLAGNYPRAVAAADKAGAVYHMIPPWRAAALVQVGETAQAQREWTQFVVDIRSRWAGETEASERAIAQWFMQAHPICRAADWVRLRDSLVAAGMPDVDAAECQSQWLME